MSEMARISDLGPAPSRKSYLFYGPPGAGKTTLAAKHPGKRKLWLDMDQKLAEMSWSNTEGMSVWTPDEPLGNPDRIDIPYSPDPKDVHKGTIPGKKPMGYEKLVNVSNELLRAAGTVTLVAGNESKTIDAFPYDVVILDTLTAVGDHWTRLLMYTHRVSFMTERLWGIYLAGMQEYINRYFTEAYYFLGRQRSGEYRLQTITDTRIAARTSSGLPPETTADATVF